MLHMPAQDGMGKPVPYGGFVQIANVRLIVGRSRDVEDAVPYAEAIEPP